MLLRYALFSLLCGFVLTSLWLKMKSNVGNAFTSSATERMQRMLFRALLVQPLVASLFILVPSVTIGMALYIGRVGR